MSFELNNWQRSDEWFFAFEWTDTTIQQEQQPLTDDNRPGSQLNIVVPTYGQFMLRQGVYYFVLFMLCRSRRCDSTPTRSLIHGPNDRRFDSVGAQNVCNAIINLIKLAWQLNLTLNSQNTKITAYRSSTWYIADLFPPSQQSAMYRKTLLSLSYGI